MANSNNIKRYGQKAKRAYYLKVLLPAIYRRAARQPINQNKVLFVEASRPVLSNSLQAVCCHLQDLGYDTRFISLGTNRLSEEQQLEAWCQLAEEAATARCIFYCEASFQLSALPRQGTDLVQLWHACGAFKKFGMSAAGKKFGGSSLRQKLVPLYNNATLVSVSSPDVVWAYQDAMQPSNPNIIQPLGTPRTDLLLNKDFQRQARGIVERAAPQAKARKIVLYAPTFRGSIKGATAPDKLDFEKLATKLGDDWCLLVKQHPHVKNRPAIPKTCQDRVADVTTSAPIEALLAAADVLITDYSSVIFEYALFDRPMALLAHDIQEYDDWRGFYYPLGELAPGPLFQTTEEVADFVLHARERFDFEALSEFKQKFMRSCDGNATQHICEHVGLEGASEQAVQSSVGLYRAENTGTGIVFAGDLVLTAPREKKSLNETNLSIELIAKSDQGEEYAFPTTRKLTERVETESAKALVFIWEAHLDYTSIASAAAGEGNKKILRLSIRAKDATGSIEDYRLASTVSPTARLTFAETKTDVPLEGSVERVITPENSSHCNFNIAIEAI